MNNVIPVQYDGNTINLTGDGWLNATQIAKRYGKRPVDWLKQDETREYLSALAEVMGKSKVTQDHFGLVRTSRGGKTPGTWMHPKLAVAFARWLDVRFAVWVDMTIDNLLRGKTSVRENFDRACLALDDQNASGSHAGRELCRHRYAKPPLEREVEYWRDQLQLHLAM